MPTYTTKVGADGMVKLPAGLRRSLHIKEGTEVEFFLTSDGYVHFHAVSGKLSDFGIPIRKPPISIREMDDAIAEAIIEKDQRSRSSSRLVAHKPAAE